jgi:multidrug resistance protein, MATE family
MPEAERYGVRRWPGWRWRAWRQQRRIGYGGGVSVGLETMSFAALSLFAGQLGARALAGYSIFMNLLALIFMFSLGVATATAVRVGVAHGRVDPDAADRAGWLGLGANTVVMIALGVLLILWAEPIAAIYSGDVELVVVAAPLIAFSAYILVVDGGQVVMLNASRGRHDVVAPTIIHAIAYIGVMAPLAWYLALEEHRGVLGLAEAIFYASIVAVGGQSLRFAFLSRRERRRAAAALAV